MNPETATRDALLVVEGDPMDPFLLRFYIDQQVPFVANDMDDVLLVGLDRPGFLGGFPFAKFKMRGDFKAMWAPHRLSRLFPEATLAFTTTFPGLKADLVTGDPGVYSFFKVLGKPKGMKGEDTPFTGSTFGKPIGVIANPSLGVISNITDADPRERLPRARIWAYYPEGSADLDAALGTTTVGKATVVATPLVLRDFPISTTTGFPDTTQFLSLGGDLADLNTGDYELSTPPFVPFTDEGIFKKKIMQQIAFGRPTGQTYIVGNANKTINKLFSGIDTAPVYGGVFVGEIQAGCVLTLVDEKGNDLTGTDILQLGEGELEGSPIDMEQGDTIYVVPPGSNDASEMDDPPTVEQLAEFASGLPSYRRGFDVIVQKRGGNFVDISMPSIKDPMFPIKEMLGQRTPAPISTIEASLEFVNNERAPHQFPALKGEPYNDNGDYGIPYLSTRNTELDRLQGVASGMQGLQVDGPAPTGTQLWLAVYPDEILGADGTVYSTYTVPDPPDTLLTASDLTPVGAGPYVANSGLGDVRPFDLLLVEVPNSGGTPAGVTGILSVGDVPSSGQLEVPRFVTPTLEGVLTPVKYTFNNAMAHVASAPAWASGMLITDAAFGPNRKTTFNVATTGIPYFNDAQGGSVGGLNRIFTGANNAIVIRLYQNGGAGSPGTLVEEIVITGSQASGGTAGGVALISVVAKDRSIEVVTAVSFVTGVGVLQDYTLTIDTYIDATTDALITSLGGLSPGVGGGTGSTSASVHTDRLTFYERVDLTSAPERGALNAGVTVIEASLNVWEITASGAPSSVNEATEVNGGLYFSFLSRDGTGTIGTFAAAPFPAELGSVKVMSWEAANTPIPLTALTFSAVPSSEIDELGVICNGTGTIPDSAYIGSIKTWVESIAVGTGAVGRVVPGDIVVVNKSAVGDGAVKAGTYLVRHAVEEDGATVGGREVVLTAQAGPSGQWLDAVLPKVTAIGALSVTISTVGVGPGTFGTLWVTATMNRLYIIPNQTDPTTIVSMQFSTFTTGGVFTLVTLTGQNAAGAFLSDVDFFAAIAVGMTATGMRYLPIGTGFPEGLPSNNVVGFDSGTTTALGFRSLILCNPSLTGDAVTYQELFTVGGANDIVVGAPGIGSTNLGIRTTAEADPKAFQSNENTVIYQDVPTFLDFRGITSTQWDNVHAAGAATTVGVLAVLPLDRFVTTTIVDATGNYDGGVPGFVALAGIFFEPSFPRPTTTLSQVVPHVVDATHTASANDQIGVRISGGSEAVTFEVRRIRRFHEALSNVTANLAPLRFAYEIRRGTVLSYTPAVPPLPGAILVADTTAFGTATQLGDFDNVDVNINPGDVIRLLDANGDVVDTAEVGQVSATSILVRNPGFTNVTPAPGDSFEVYLRQAPVPQEQSNQELFDIMVGEVIYETTPNYTTGAGGFVTVFNQLQDSTVADFNLLGVREGDYIIIDPAGPVEGPTGPAVPPESGMRPIGDESVPARGPGAPYQAGGPSPLDDNRGFYRVVSVDPLGAYIEVTGVSDFSGDGTTDVVYGAGGEEYAVLPTISASPVSNLLVNPSFPREGQQDLRATAPADPGTNSFDQPSNAAFSIQPFGYRIVRPTSLFSQNAVELTFFIRERMLSWLEELSTSVDGTKSGSYFVFQRDEHISDLGSPTNPTDGKGLISNDFITGLGGFTDVSPFANVSDCLSVLDRRYWGLDFRLDIETPIGSAIPYADFENGSGRPVLPDRVDDVLDRDDRLRLLRYSWIKFRTDRVYGTLPSLVRFAAELPVRLAEEQELLLLNEGLDKT